MKESEGGLQTAKPKALITGINGFVGSHLAELLVSEGYRVSGLALLPNLDRLEAVRSQVSVTSGDIRDKTLIEKVLSDTSPDYIYHLAGSAFLPDAEADPRLVYETNVFGTLNVLDGARSARLNAKTLIVGSGEVYGHVPEERLPVNEEVPLNPVSPYGVTKACADLLAYQYATTYRMDVIRARPFNHIGPRQSEQFVCSSFAKQIAEIEFGIRPPFIYVGNLEVKRDFTDVRDVARAYRIILENGRRGEVYNVGRNRSWRIGDLLALLLQESNVKEIRLERRENLTRPHDISVMLCDASKLERQWGWKPEIPIDQTIRDLLDYWREAVRAT